MTFINIVGVMKDKPNIGAGC